MSSKIKSSLYNESTISKKADILIKKDKAAKMLLKNPPKFSLKNYKKIRKWILSLADLIY